jgi:hypothetical protein
MRTCQTKRGLVYAIRKLDETAPAAPLKGRDHRREPTTYGPLLAAIIGRDIGDCNHVHRAYLLRTHENRFSKMMYGREVDFVSPELAKLLEANADIVEKLHADHHGHVGWIDATK